MEKVEIHRPIAGYVGVFWMSCRGLVCLGPDIRLNIGSPVQGSDFEASAEAALISACHVACCLAKLSPITPSSLFRRKRQPS